MYQKFIRRMLALSVSFLLVFALIIIVVDPFFHYHKPLGNLKPLINDERYQNPGIAEHFDYDSILTGSSMTENFKISELNEAFSCDTVKLSYAAIRTGSYKYMFEKAFATQNVKNVFMGLDVDPLIDTYGNYYFPLPEYLYDDKVLNDVNYFWNKTVMFKNTYQYLKQNYLKTVPDIDTVYCWEGDFSQKNALQSVTWDLCKKSEENENLQYLENTKMNLNNNILPYIEENPETIFYIFFPPYSLLWWNMHLSEGDLKSIIDVIEYTSEALLEYDNVKLFYFQDIESIVTNLELYKDYNHYGPDINSEIVKWLKNDEYRVYSDTYKKRLEDFEQYIRMFDYCKWQEYVIYQ